MRDSELHKKLKSAKGLADIALDYTEQLFGMARTLPIYCIGAEVIVAAKIMCPSRSIRMRLEEVSLEEAEEFALRLWENLLGDMRAHVNVSAQVKSEAEAWQAILQSLSCMVFLLHGTRARLRRLRSVTPADDYSEFDAAMVDGMESITHPGPDMVIANMQEEQRRLEATRSLPLETRLRLCEQGGLEAGRCGCHMIEEMCLDPLLRRTRPVTTRLESVMEGRITETVFTPEEALDARIHLLHRCRDRADFPAASLSCLERALEKATVRRDEDQENHLVVLRRIDHGTVEVVRRCDGE